MRKSIGFLTTIFLVLLLACPSNAGKIYPLGTSNASGIYYDNTISGRTSTNVKGALDELDAAIDTVNGLIISANTTGINWTAMEVTADTTGLDTNHVIWEVGGETVKMTGASLEAWVKTVSPGIADGDKGSITVSSSGATWTLDDATVTAAKMANADHGDVAWASGVATVQAATGALAVGAALDVVGVIQAGSGNHDLTNAAGLIDGEKVQDDTIDDDSLDLTDITLADFTFDVGNVSTTEFGYLNDVTSAIQTQLDARCLESVLGTALDASQLAVASNSLGIIENGITTTEIAANTITTADLAAALTFAEGDFVDLSAITMSAGVDEGIALPTYADVAPANEKYYMAYSPGDNAIMVRESGGWVNASSGAAAPTNAHYLVTNASGSLSDESVLTEGLAIDISDAGGDGGAATVAFDPTELTGDRIWAAGGSATIAWTWNLSAGDPTLTFGNDLITSSNSVTVATGKNITLGTTQWNSGDEIDGTKVKDADLGDVSVSAAGAWSVDAGTITAAKLATADFGPWSNTAGTITQDADSINDTHIDWGTGANQVSLDDVTDGSSYERVAAADVASGHITVLTDTDGTGSATITGLTQARAITLVDAAQTLANLASDQTFTGSLSVGNADTDTLTIRSLLIGGNDRALWIAASAPTPTYATTADDLYIAGNEEVAGTVYANNFISTATGGGYWSLNNFSAGRDPVTGQYALWFETDGTDQLKYSVNGSEKAVVNVQDAQTLSGAKTLSAALTLNRGATGAGQLIIAEDSDDGAHTVTLTGQAMAASYTLTLPADDGTNGQALTTNGSGVTSWGSVSATAGGSDTQVQFNDGGTTLAGDAGFIFVKATDTLTLGEDGADGVLVLYNESGATDYNLTLQPGTQSSAATLTMPGSTATLATLGLAETFSGTKTFSAAPIPSAATIDLGTTAAEWRNLYLTDGGILYLGADQDVTLTHVADTGVRLNAAMQLQFRDTAIHIASLDDGHLDLTADTSIDLNGAVVATGTVGVATSLNPDASDGATLGTTALEWSDLYLADGGVIYGQADQSNTLTSSATGWVMNLDLTITGNDLTFGNAEKIDNTTNGTIAITAAITSLTGALDVTGGAITLQNDETIGNADDTEVSFNGTEAVALDLDTGTANQVQWKNRTTSTTGVTEMNFSALNLVTTGQIHGGIEIIADDTSLDAAQCYGSINNTNGAETITLPAAVVGMNVLIYSNDATVKHVDPNGTDTIVLTTAALTAGYQIESPGAAGDFIALVCMTANQWTCMGRSGVWITHGAD